MFTNDSMDYWLIVCKIKNDKKLTKTKKEKQKRKEKRRKKEKPWLKD